MKKIVISSSIIFLLIICFTSSCQKDESFETESILGKWEWIYTYGGFGGVTYPQEGQSVILEFTKDNRLIESENGVTSFETDYSVFRRYS